MRAATLRRYEELLAAATAIVEADYASDLQLPAVAARVFCSTRTLERAYSEVGETTFRGHLRQVRLRRGAELLATGDVRVRHAARRVGYRHAAQFAQAFQLEFGVLPHEYATHLRRR